MLHTVGGPLFWAVVYAGVLGSAALRRWRQSREPFRQGTAGWDETPSDRPFLAGSGLEVAKDLGHAACVGFRTPFYLVFTVLGWFLD